MILNGVKVQVLLRRSVFRAAVLALLAAACAAVGPASSAMAEPETVPATKPACRTKCPGGRPPEIKDARNSCSETASDIAFYCRNKAGKLTFCDCVYQTSEPEETESYGTNPDSRPPPAENGGD